LRNPSLIQSEIALKIFQEAVKESLTYVYGQLLILLFIDAVFFAYVPLPILVLWNGAMVGNLLLRYHLLRHYVRRVRDPRRRIFLRILRSYFASLLLSGILWAGMVPLLAYVPWTYHLFVYGVILLMTFAAIQSIGPILPFFLAFALPMNLAMFLHLFLSEDPLFRLQAFGLLLGLLYSITASERRMKEYTRIVRDKLHAQKLKEHFHRLALRDPLTGLPNRYAFFEHLETELESARRSGRSFTLLFLDLDRFKPINDTLGHAIGDQVLIAVGERLRQDLGTPTIPARLAGDEFVLILPKVATPEAAWEVARTLQSRFQTPLSIEGHTLPLHLSIGIVLYPQDGTSSDLLLSRADGAMYASKKTGHPTFYHSDLSLQNTPSSLSRDYGPGSVEGADRNKRPR
jgi:diguanylate cyclase (GGDEF)-like protein